MGVEVVMSARPIDLLRIPVSAVMTRGPATVEELAPLADAAAEMAAGGFRQVPVVDAGGRLVGMISERDLRARVGTELRRFAAAADAALAASVGEAMSPDPVTLPPQASLADALVVFADGRVDAVPVLDERGRLVGIVSYVDLLGTLRALSEAGARRAARPVARELARARHGASRKPGGHRRATADEARRGARH